MDETNFGTFLERCNQDQKSDKGLQAANRVGEPTIHSGRKNRYPFPIKNPPRITEDQQDKGTWLTAKQLAEYIGTSVGSVRTMVWRGQITAHKPFGKLLFKRVEIDRIIEASRLRSSYEED